MNDYEAILATRMIDRDLAIADATAELLAVIPDAHIWRVDMYGDGGTDSDTETRLSTNFGIGLPFETATDLGLDSDPDERLEDWGALESIGYVPVKSSTFPSPTGVEHPPNRTWRD